MSRFTRLLATLAPSVPPTLQARCLAAMEGRTLTPAPGACGEAAPGAGDYSAAARLDSTPTAAADTTPEGGVTPVPSPSGPPACEIDLFWEPAPDAAFDFSPGRIDVVMDRWTQEGQA